MRAHAVLLPAVLALAATNAQAQAETKVTIGTASPLSGPGAHQGKDIENGARMAIDELNAQGVTIGGRKVRFQLLAEDDASDPKTGTVVAQKLVDAKVAAVVGHLNSGPTVPASKIYSNAGIPQISPAATTPVYTQQGYKTAFRVVANDILIGRTLANYALGTLKAKRIAIIDDRTAFGQGLADQFAKEVRWQGDATVIGREFTTDKATDFNAILTRIRARKPDLIFYGGMDAVAGPMLKQMKTLGIQAQMVAGDGVCSEKLPQLAGDALADGKVVCAVAGGVEGGREAGFNSFLERYRQRFGIPVETYAPYAYDAVMVFVGAMQKAGSVEPARFMKELHGIRHEGVTGTIAFDANGDLRNAAMTLYTYRNGKKAKLQVVRGK